LTFRFIIPIIIHGNDKEKEVFLNKKAIFQIVLFACAVFSVHSKAIYDDVYDVNNFQYVVFEKGDRAIANGLKIDSALADEYEAQFPGLILPPFNERSIMIFNYTGNKNIVRIPPHINHIPVTHIGTSTFSDKRTVTGVIIPDSVVFIGWHAFTRSGLSEITIPESVTYIGYAAFSETFHLRKIIIPSSVTHISGSAFFRSTRLAEAVIPDSITTIESDTFASCALTAIDIPSSVTVIQSGAFARCRLTNLVIPDSVTSIRHSAFQENQLTNVVIPNSITRICNSTFADNLLTEIIIPESVTVIEANAFGRNPITRITIGADVEFDKTNMAFDIPAFPNGFDNFYISNDRRAGTYTYSGGEWEYTN
jgi:hypothetical protein